MPRAGDRPLGSPRLGLLGLPLASLQADPEKRNQELIGLEMEKLEGHALVIGPTRSGKGMHLTETILHYPGAMVIIDPKGEQHQRTAGSRQRLGPVYNLPQHSLDLADYYDLGARFAVFEEALAADSHHRAASVPAESWATRRSVPYFPQSERYALSKRMGVPCKNLP